MMRGLSGSLAGALLAFIVAATAQTISVNPGPLPTISGDCTNSGAALTCTKTSGSNFAPSATTDTTNGSNIASGTVAAARMPAGLSQVLGSLRGANFNTTADQAIAIRSAITKFAVSGITVTNCTGTMTLAVGGFYPTTSKGGTALVAAGQAYSALSGITILLPATLAATTLTTAYTVTNIYLSLTVATGSAATCDVYIIGTDLT